MSGRETMRAERIYDAVGTIDDKLIADAQSPKRARDYIRVRRQRRLSSLAVACVFCIFLTAVFNLPDLLRSEGPPKDAQNSSASSNTANGQNSLEQVLLYSAESVRVERIEAEHIDHFDGEAKIIWQTNEGTDYNVARITYKNELADITEALSQPSAQLSPDAADKVGVKVWISYGDGRVISPYLSPSAGNIGYAQLFEYTAEVEPSEKLTDIITDLIK